MKQKLTKEYVDAMTKIINKTNSRLTEAYLELDNYKKKANNDGVVLYNHDLSRIMSLISTHMIKEHGECLIRELQIRLDEK